LWGSIKVTTEKAKDAEDKDKKASKSLEEFTSAVLVMRATDKLKGELETLHFGTTVKDKEGKVLGQGGAILMLKKAVQLNGLGRLRAPEHCVSAWAWCIQRWEKATQQSCQPMIDLMESHAVFLLSKLGLVAIQPEDFNRDVAGIPYVTKPGYDREPQKLVE
jgi:hypothetical protein